MDLKEEYRQKVLEYIDEKVDDCVALLQDIIRIPTENRPPNGCEKKCQQYMQQRFLELCMEVDMFTPDSIENIETHPGYLKGRDYTDRPNLIGIYRGKASKKRIMISAHADVVPAGDLSLWTVDPWSGLVEDGRIYGRGAGDDKEGIAAMYAALKSIIDCGILLDNDVILASVVDEESGGANGSLAAILKYPCDYYVNVDGVDFDIVPVSVSGGRFRIDFDTVTDTVCSKDCADAIMILHNELKYFEKIKIEEFDNNPQFKDVSFKHNALRILELRAGDEEDSTSHNKGVIKCYVYSTENKETNEKQLLEIIDRSYEKMDKTKIKKPVLMFYRRFFNGAKTDVDNILVKTMAQNYEHITGEKAKIKAGPISDLPLYYEFGSGSCVCCGIGSMEGRGSAHMPDECICIDEFVRLIKVIALTLIDLGLNN